MRTQSIILALGLTLLLTACAKPRVDTSSDEAMKRSIKAVRESLPENERAKFDESLRIVALSQVDFSTLVATGSSGVNLTEAKVKEVLAGKTAEEIIASADRIITERQQKERAQALSEIKELGPNGSTLAARLLLSINANDSMVGQDATLKDLYEAVLTEVRKGREGTSSSLFYGLLATHQVSKIWMLSTRNSQILWIGVS